MIMIPIIIIIIIIIIITIIYFKKNNFINPLPTPENSRRDWVCPPKTIPESNAKMLILLFYVLKEWAISENELQLSKNVLKVQFCYKYNNDNNNNILNFQMYINK